MTTPTVRLQSGTHAVVDTKPMLLPKREGAATKVHSARALSAVPTIHIGKWTVRILFMLKVRPHRHSELRRRLGGISQRMLTKTLRGLESGGLIARRVTRSKPLAVEYSLTALGSTFLVPLGSICRWASRHDKDLIAVIRLVATDRDSSA